MPIYLQSENEDREINSVVSGRIFQTDQVMVCQLKAKRGEIIHPHSHEVDQIPVMLKGCLDWQIEGEERRLVKAGDVMVMPAKTVHGGAVVEDAEYVDVFAPPNRDFGWDKLASSAD